MGNVKLPSGFGHVHCWSWTSHGTFSVALGPVKKKAITVLPRSLLLGETLEAVNAEAEYVHGQDVHRNPLALKSIRATRLAYNRERV